MPVNFMRRLTGPERSAKANLVFGGFLAFVAGAVNAGGFLAVNQYTSHMSGIFSSVADNLVLGNGLLLIAGVGSLLAFVSGAATTAIMINWARHRKLRSEYALPLVTEAGLLLLFGLLGATLQFHYAVTVPLTVLLLCYIMGLQNAIMSKMSNAEIRTTHVTGTITDLGIELGRMLYWNRHHKRHTPGYVASRSAKVTLYVTLLTAFFTGAVIGAIGFKHVGYVTVLPFALALIVAAAMPLLDDAVQLLRAGQR